MLISSIVIGWYLESREWIRSFLQDLTVLITAMTHRKNINTSREYTKSSISEFIKREKKRLDFS